MAGWEQADLKGDRARKWVDAMVDTQVHMGTTLDLLWTARAGLEASLKDPDRRLITPEGLKRQGRMKKHLGDRPDWDIHPGFYDTGAGSLALEKQQQMTRMLHECGGRVVGGTDCGALSYPHRALPCYAKLNSWRRPSAIWRHCALSLLSRRIISALMRILGLLRRGVTRIFWC